MTNQPANYEQSLKRAHDEGYFIRTSEPGKWTVTNDAKLSMAEWYTVRLSGRVLECDCLAGEHGVYCKHRALVHDYIVRQIQQAAIVRNYIKQAATVPAWMMK